MPIGVCWALCTADCPLNTGQHLLIHLFIGNAEDFSCRSFTSTIATMADDLVNILRHLVRVLRVPHTHLL